MIPPLTIAVPAGLASLCLAVWIGLMTWKVLQMQATLFDYARTRARHSDPDTSRKAASSMVGRISKVRQDVLLYALSQPDGFTDYDLCEHFGNHGSTYRTRRSELTDRGEIVPTQQRRALPSGRTAVVWCHHSFMERTQ